MGVCRTEGKLTRAGRAASLPTYVVVLGATVIIPAGCYSITSVIAANLVSVVLYVPTKCNVQQHGAWCIAVPLPARNGAQRGRESTGPWNIELRSQRCVRHPCRFCKPLAQKTQFGGYASGSCRRRPSYSSHSSHTRSHALRILRVRLRLRFRRLLALAPTKAALPPRRSPGADLPALSSCYCSCCQLLFCISLVLVPDVACSSSFPFSLLDLCPSHFASPLLWLSLPLFDFPRQSHALLR